jgi:hypothetical protein
MWYNYSSSNRINSSGDARNIPLPEQVLKGELTMSDSTPLSSARKVCKSCGQSKPLSEYSVYRSGSYKLDCKACAAEYARKRRAENPELAKEIKRKSKTKNRERNNAAISARIATDPEFRKKRNEQKRRWHQANQEHVAKWRAEYYATSGEIARQYSRDARVKQHEKYKARYLVASAVQSNRFPPVWTMVCEYCQEAQAAEWHHHKGYSGAFALDVVALCMECHGKEHRKA